MPYTYPPIRRIENWLSNQFDSLDPEKFKHSSQSIVIDVPGLKDVDFTYEIFLLFNDYIWFLKLCSVMKEIIEMIEELVRVGHEKLGDSN